MPQRIFPLDHTVLIFMRSQFRALLDGGKLNGSTWKAQAALAFTQDVLNAHHGGAGDGPDDVPNDRLADKYTLLVQDGDELEAHAP